MMDFRVLSVSLTLNPSNAGDCGFFKRAFAIQVLDDSLGSTISDPALQ